MKEVLNVGVIGLGNRGSNLLENCILPQPGVRVLAVCDNYEDRREKGVQLVTAAGQPAPRAAADYREVLAMPEIDAVVIMASWESHLNLACDAMRAGKYTAVEVAGAYSVEDCWKLVRTHEETGVPCMMLENCCFGRDELMVLNMVRQGLFDEVRALLAAGIPADCTAMQAIGYKEAVAAVRGEATAREAADAIRLASRQYAKRQLTWLRRDAQLFWLRHEKTPDMDLACRRSTQFLAGRGIE